MGGLTPELIVGAVGLPILLGIVASLVVSHLRYEASVEALPRALKGLGLGSLKRLGDGRFAPLKGRLTGYTVTVDAEASTITLALKGDSPLSLSRATPLVERLFSSSFDDLPEAGGEGQVPFSTGDRRFDGLTKHRFALPGILERLDARDEHFREVLGFVKRFAPRLRELTVNGKRLTASPGRRHKDSSGYRGYLTAADVEALLPAMVRLARSLGALAKAARAR